MAFTVIICIIGSILGLFIIIKPLEIMNAIRVMFILKELDADDFEVFRYRVGGIAIFLICSLTLVRALT